MRFLTFLLLLGFAVGSSTNDRNITALNATEGNVDSRILKCCDEDKDCWVTDIDKKIWFCRKITDDKPTICTNRKGVCECKYTIQ